MWILWSLALVKNSCNNISNSRAQVSRLCYFLWLWWGSDTLLLLEFINIRSIPLYNVMKFIILLHTVLVISFLRYKEYMTWQISFSIFLDELPAFTCISIFGNLWNIYLGNIILRSLPYGCLLSSVVFSRISSILFGFSFLRIFLLLREFLN